MFRSGALASSVVALAAVMALPAATGAAAPPAPCNNAPQITDAALDGHHPGTDVLAAWWSEAGGRLQAVIQTRVGLFYAEHDDAEVQVSIYALVFTAGGKTWYVRANGPETARSTDPPTYEYGTVTPPGNFARLGVTTGTVERSTTAGTVTIDVPAAIGATAGARLTNPYVITIDGINDGDPTYVDHAPGGEGPIDSARGADYVVGSCATTLPPDGTPGPDGGSVIPITGTQGVTSVQLSAPARVTGRKTVTLTGKVLPARLGVPVTLTRTAKRTATSGATTGRDGTFRLRVAIGETTRLRATAGGIGSSEVTITARSRVRIKVRNRADGSAVVTGTVDPKLPGRVLWLRSNAIRPSARATTRTGKFTLRLKSPQPGRYQAVVIPDGKRAERATSNTGVIR